MLQTIHNSFLKLLSILNLSSKPRITINESPTVLTNSNNKQSTSLHQIITNCKSLNTNFTPTPWLASGHLSTIWCTIADFSYQNCSYSRKLLQLPDGGSISLDFTPPISRERPLDDGTPILVTLHGLTGGSHESYVIDVLSKITRPRYSTTSSSAAEEKQKSKNDPEGLGLGWRGCVVNFRGCAGTPLTSSKLYHGGYTDDLRCALAFLSHAAPKSPLYGVGFSLGANVLAKYVGEEGTNTPLKAAVVLGCPWDFLAGHVYLSSSWIQQVYSRAMAANLRRVVTRNKAALDSNEAGVDFDALYGNPHQTLYEFDSVGTRVLGGFKSTEAYYRYASSNQYASNVAIPLLSISATDDPIVPSTTIPLSAASTNPNLVFVTTQNGGHLGWFENVLRPRRWIARPVIEFLREVERADPVAREDRLAKTVPERREGVVPVLGGEMVRVLGKEESLGFREVAEGTVEGDGDPEDDGLIRGL
ncbi:AB-hydrolase YheT [Meredithblackwellia eburnea MCA 4105]